jgi:hypothetical protein
MRWIQSILLDLLVLVVAIVAVVTEASWSWWVLMIYTPLMIALKVLGFFAGPVVRQSRGTDSPPELVFHLLYAAMVVLMIIGGRWLLVVGWLVIWLLSFLTDRRLSAATTRPAARRRS